MITGETETTEMIGERVIDTETMTIVVMTLVAEEGEAEITVEAMTETSREGIGEMTEMSLGQDLREVLVNSAKKINKRSLMSNLMLIRIRTVR